jgi:hypothetical protein
LIHRGVITLGNFREGFTLFHAVGEAATTGPRGGCSTISAAAAAVRRGNGTARQQQALAGLHQLGILDAIGPHQLLEANAVAFGDLGEGLAGLHHHRAGFGATVRAAVGSAAAAAPVRRGGGTARQQ